jgi:hypothetical protein
LILLAGVLAAGAMAIWPVQMAYRVSVVDFASLQKEKLGQFSAAVGTLALEAGMDRAPDVQSTDAVPLDQFIAKETDGWLIEGSGHDWSKFCLDVESALGGKSTKLAWYLERSSTPEHLYFPLDYAPLTEVAGRLPATHTWAYVHVYVNGRDVYLNVLGQRSGDLMRQAPAWLVFPWRQQAAWVFFLGLAAYAFLPWHRRQAGEVRPMTFRAIILPDIIGVILTAMFALAPIFIIPRAGSPMEPWGILSFDGGWGVLTLVMWFMALFGLGAMVASLSSAVTSVLVLPDRLRVSRLRGTAEYPYEQIAAAEPVLWETPPKLRLLLILIGLFNWRFLGMVLLTTSRSMTGVGLCLKDGKKVNLWTDAMPGSWQILAGLRANNVPMPEEMAATIPQTPPPEAPPGVSFAGHVAGMVAVAVLGGGALGLAYLPEKTPTVAPAAAPARVVSPEAYALRQEILRKMQELQPQMKAALEETKKAGASSHEALDRYTALLAQFQDLQQQFEKAEKPGSKGE